MSKPKPTARRLAALVLVLLAVRAQAGFAHAGESDLMEPFAAPPRAFQPHVVTRLDAAPNPNPKPRPAPLAGTLPDHTLTALPDRAALDRLCALPGQALACKFTAVRPTAADVVVHYYDPRFYAFHDEWYWLPRLPTRHASVPDAYRAVAAMTTPPNGLVWLDGRLYDDSFYELAARPAAKGSERPYFSGTLRHLPPEPKRSQPGALWLVELEEGDDPTDAELRGLFAALRRTLPPEVAAALRLLVRPTAAQEALGRRVGGPKGWLAGRVLRYDDLVVPGRAIGYTAGVAAGTLRILRVGDDPMTTLGPDDIVLLDWLPDALPPVAGILSLHEQAPQAHVNLLAAARGTPNAAAPDLVRDSSLRTLAERGVAVALRVGPDGAEIRPLGDAQWRHWLSLDRPFAELPRDPHAGPGPWLVDPVALAADPTATAPRVSVVGGKGLGMFHLLRTRLPPAAALPFAPVVVGTRCYRETLAPLEGALLDLLDDEHFGLDRRVRMLALEGEAAFRKRVPDADAFLRSYASHVRGPAVRHIIARGGVVPMIEQAKLAPACAAVVLPALARRFAALAPEQGLRFRSSSSVEDLPGFNGAGLYRSVTGLLRGGKRGPAEALLRVFASYWGYEAFEERVHAGIWHLDGAMAVLVHPRFDDEKERANGVVLARFSDPAGGPVEVVVEINAQAGAVSVTNPRGEQGGKPWRARLRRVGDGRFHVEQQAGVRPPALDDGTLDALANASEAAAFGQLVRDRKAHEKSARKGYAAPESTVADLEFRVVDEGWPALQRGAPLPGRLVLKQLRPLSRPVRLELKQLDRDAKRRRPRHAALVPVDLLPYAVAVDERSCSGRGVRLRAVRVHLDAAVPLRPIASRPRLFGVQVRGKLAGDATAPLVDDAAAAAAGLKCRDRALATGPRAWLLGLF